MENFSLIITAAGAGTRFGGKLEKQFTQILGKPLLYWSVKAFMNIKQISEVVLVIPENSFEKNFKIFKNAFSNIKVVVGGEDRFQSVYRGLDALKNRGGFVLIHDGVRACISKKTIDSIIKKTQECGGTIPVVPCVGSLKEVQEGRVVKSLDRDKIFSATTPQCFRLVDILLLYKKALSQKLSFADEASMFEHYGREVCVVYDTPTNIKITTKEDLAFATFILSSSYKKPHSNNLCSNSSIAKNNLN